MHEPSKILWKCKKNYLPFPYTMNKLSHAFNFIQIQGFVHFSFRIKECHNATIYIPAVG